MKEQLVKINKIMKKTGRSLESIAKEAGVNNNIKNLEDITHEDAKTIIRCFVFCLKK